MWVLQGMLFTAIASGKVQEYRVSICIFGTIASFLVGLSLLVGTTKLDYLHGNLQPINWLNCILSFIMPWSLLPLIMACGWWIILHNLKNPVPELPPIPTHMHSSESWGILIMVVVWVAMYSLLACKAYKENDTL